LKRQQRRMAAVAAADVAGYLRLMGRGETGTLAALKQLRQDIVDPAIAGHQGRIVKTTGDGLLLEFLSVVDALQCVVSVQTAMTDHNADVHRRRQAAHDLRQGGGRRLCRSRTGIRARWIGDGGGDGTVVATLNVGTVSARYPAAKSRIIAGVVRAAAAISKRLGYRRAA
jgi:class 3 adenylate cyclase